MTSSEAVPDDPQHFDLELWASRLQTLLDELSSR